MGVLRRLRRPAKLDVDLVIDLRAHVETVDSKLGEPGHCPGCNGAGYLDVIDLRNGRQYQHCKKCRREWSIKVASSP